MTDSERLLVVFTTVPDEATGRRLAETLVAERLAACVQVLGELTAVYRWEGKIESGTERLCLLKTTAARRPELERRLRELHPYAVPQIVALQAEAVSAAYLAWVVAETKPPEGNA